MDSYRGVCSLQAWRTSLLAEKIGPEALGFFLEGQNDALTSHVLAQVGAWRSALKALRSCIENVLFCLYYKDDPVELKLWETGKHAMAISALFAYFDKHPLVEGVPDSTNGLAVLKSEYPTLSRAVHGSAASFRMTGSGSTQLWSSDAGSLGSWRTRETSTLTGLNLVLLSLYREELQGARLLNLRKAVSLAIPASNMPDIRRTFNVRLFSR